MRVKWYGQSAFRCRARTRCVIDPFGGMPGLAARGLQFDYPPIEGVEADVLLVTHEHVDHNAVEAVGGEPKTIRSTAGTARLAGRRGRRGGVRARRGRGHRARPEHDLLLRLDGVRVCHFGDFGQLGAAPGTARGDRQGRPAVRAGRRRPDDRRRAGAAIVARARAALGRADALPDAAIDFLEPADEFLAALGARGHAARDERQRVDELLGTSAAPRVALFAPPLA